MIFNKSNNGTLEAKALLGFLYKANSFENLITFIDIAERETRRVIGPEVFLLAENHYKSANFKKEAESTPQQLLLDELVRLVQLPVIILAYGKYAIHNDLSHTESGRRMAVSDELKLPFPWILERNDRALLDLAFKTTDILIEFLDAQVKIDENTPNSIEDTWRGSTTFSAQKDLFINSALEFDGIFPIGGSRRLFLVLVPFIREVEIRHIRPVITAARYDLVRELIKDGDLDKEGNEESAEIHLLSKVSIALLTMAVALKRLSVELLPDSVVQSFISTNDKKSQTADSTTRKSLAKELERDGIRELVPLQNYITSLLPAAVIIEETFDTTTPFSMF